MILQTIKSLANAVFITSLGLFIQGCDTTPPDSFLATEALHVVKLPSSAKVIDSNFQSGPMFDFYEYYLEINADQYDKFLSGRDYQPCETQIIKSHDAFASFNSYPNIQLVNCVKAISNQNSVAIYRDQSGRHIFITFNN